MKRTELQRRPMKRSQPRRYWEDARAKVEEEGACRYYRSDPGCAGKLEAAHITGRAHDQLLPCKRCGGSGLDPHDAFADADGVDNIEAPCRFCGHGQADWVNGKANVLYVDPMSIVPLCKVHHDRYDGRDPHRIDILPALTLEEQVQAVRDAGGIEQARVRTCPSQYRSER